MIDDDSRAAPRIIIAPDSFKGSASATEVAQAIARGVRAGLGGDAAHARVETLPFADGGEGTLSTIAAAGGVEVVTVAATDALGRPVEARWGLSTDGRVAIIEAAEANGLPGVSDRELRPLEASSHGVGVIARAALDRGVRRIDLFVGGSASTDGGAGMLEALGARLLDADGRPLPRGGGALRDLVTVDLAALHPRARLVEWRIACDVPNPLVGDRGAAAVFGPQKGATAPDVAVLDASLRRLADVLGAATGVETATLAGAGAAGGIPASLVACVSAALLPGWEVVADAVGARERFANADLVITGEGRLDATSLEGKVVQAVRRMTPGGVPVVVIAGEAALSASELVQGGITAAFSLAPGPRTLDQLRADVLIELERTGFSIARIVGALNERRAVG